VFLWSIFVKGTKTRLITDGFRKNNVLKFRRYFLTQEWDWPKKSCIYQFLRQMQLHD